MNPTPPRGGSVSDGLLPDASPFLFAGMAACAVMALAQIWIPLTPHRAGPTVLVVLSAAGATWAFTAAAWGWRRAALALAWVGGVTLVVERIGVATGWPFGRYHYTGVLRPEIWHVPMVVPLAWFALGIPAREVASRLVQRRAARIALAAIALTAWDLFLDPQMVHEGYWRWSGEGFWRAVPLSNFAGWLVVSFAVLAVVDVIAPAHAAAPAGSALVGMYTWWAVMETVGFVVFFGDATVGLVGGLAMGLPAGFAWRRSIATRRSRAGHASVAGPVAGH